MSRRRLAAFGKAAAAFTVAALGLGGCGFRPVYGPPGQNVIAGEVFVDTIPNRNGQLLRQALQAQLEGSAATATYKYVLVVAYGEGAQAVGIQHDNTTTREAYSATAIWSLHKAGLGSPTITSGTSRALDGANIVEGQFFYNSLNNEAIDARMAQNLANQIVLSLASYFRSHPELAKAG